VLADDPVSADATCARLMGMVPERIPHIAGAGKFLGNLSLDRVDQMAGQVVSPGAPFDTVLEFDHLHPKPSCVTLGAGRVCASSQQAVQLPSCPSPDQNRHC